MVRLVVTKEYEDELDVLDRIQPDLVDAAELLVESLYEDPVLLDHLHDPSSYPLHTPVFEIKRFEEAMRLGYNVFILKFKNLDGFPIDHRIFLGFNPQSDIFYVLAITDRDYSYDTNHPSFRDLGTRYDKYRLPQIT